MAQSPYLIFAQINHIGLLIKERLYFFPPHKGTICFRQAIDNVGQEEAYLMAILGGTDAGRVSWAPQVLEQARQTGLQLDAQGNLVES
jgi:hypothetical protein